MNGLSTKGVNTVIMYMNKSHYTITKQVKGVENGKSLPQYFIFLNKDDFYWNMRLLNLCFVS